MYCTDSLDSVVDNDEFGEADSRDERDEDDPILSPSTQLLLTI